MLSRGHVALVHHFVNSWAYAPDGVPVSCARGELWECNDDFPFNHAETAVAMVSDNNGNSQRPASIIAPFLNVETIALANFQDSASHVVLTSCRLASSSSESFLQ